MKNVVIEVPYGYELTGKTRGQRKDRDYLREASIAVAVASPTDAEAPIALVWHRRIRYASEGEVHPPRTFRSFNGKLYRPLETDPGSRYPAENMTTEQFKAVVADRGERSPLLAGKPRTHWDYGEKLQAALDVGNALVVSTSSEDEVAAQIRRKAMELILVDGLVHQETTEPVYVLKVRSNAFEAPVGAELAFLGRLEGPLDVATHFRADQLPDVLQTIASRMRREEPDFDPSDPESFRNSIPDWVEVRDASVLTLSLDQGPKLLKEAQSKIDYLGKNLADASLDKLVAYAHLRDGLKEDAPIGRIADLCIALTEAYSGDWWVEQLRGEVEKFRMAPIVEAAPTARALRA